MHTVNVAIILAVPAAILRTPRLLSYLSFVGVCSTVYVVFALLFYAVIDGDVSSQIADRQGLYPDAPHHLLWRSSGLPLALGIVAFSFSGHAVVPSIYVSMDRPQEFEHLIISSFFVVFLCCCIVSFSGYLIFGTFVADQVTLSLARLSSSSPLAVTTLTSSIVLTVFSKFCLQIYPLALGVEELFAHRIRDQRLMNALSVCVK